MIHCWITEARQCSSIKFTAPTMLFLPPNPNSDYILQGTRWGFLLTQGPTASASAKKKVTGGHKGLLANY